MTAPLVECVPNFSEGRDPATIDALRAAISAVPGAQLLDVQSDTAHNRSVFTFVAPPAAAVAAGGATNVNTERLCAVSDCTSSSCAPGTALIAARSASMVAGSRPSEKFGTHSTSGAVISSSLIDR